MSLLTQRSKIVDVGGKCGAWNSETLPDEFLSQFSCGSDDKDQIGGSGGKHLEVEELYLGTNSISLNAAKSIAKLIEKCTNLRILHLDSCFMNRDVYEARDSLKLIFSALVTSKCPLEEILLNHNAFGSQVSQSFPYLFANPQIMLNLERVHIFDCGMAIKSAELLAECFEKAFKQLQNDGTLKDIKLKTLNMSISRIENQGIKPLCDILSKYVATLEHISFGTSVLTNEGIAELPKVIDSNPNLKSFAINDNFYDQAAYDLCKSFIEAKNLRLLDLSDCMAAENFANQILNGIALSKSPIETLLLNGNSFKSQHLEKIITILENKASSLKMLNLVDNELSSNELDILERAVDHLYPKNNLTVLTDSFKRERVQNDMVKNEFDIIQFIERGDFDSFKNFDFADYEKKIDQFCHCEKFSFNQAIQVLLKLASFVRIHPESFADIKKYFEASFIKFIAKSIEKSNKFDFFDLILTQTSLIKPEDPKTIDPNLSPYMCQLVCECTINKQNGLDSDFSELLHDLLRLTNKKFNKELQESVINKLLMLKV